MVYSLQISELKPLHPSKPLLPRIQPRMDDESFHEMSNRYPVWNSDSIFAGYELYWSETYQDTRVLMERQFEGNLAHATGPIYGYADCRLIARNYHNAAPGLTALSWLSMGALPLLGMPHSVFKQQTELEVRIYTTKGDLAGIYTGTGSARCTQGFYIYTADARRQLSLRATRLALDEIGEKIQKDTPRLKEALLKAGYLP
ncbi:MAG: hypothetical protein EAZ89_19830 [Bacteroidetes bacterium]|nr:MAG: hypothetical protein EAZ89_19830 [Bacteroidota bacterium]